MKPSRWILAGMLSIAGASCSFMSPQSDPTRYYILTPIEDGAGASASNNSARASSLSIGVGPVTLPDYLSRTEVVTRLSGNQVEISPVDRWAEPLDRNFSRVLSQNLIEMLGTPRVARFPWGASKIDYQVQVNVYRFEPMANGSARLFARWTIKDGHTGEIVTARQTDVSEPTASKSDASTALSTDLGALSRNIAQAIMQASDRRKSSGARNTISSFLSIHV
jgi:uncharacterized protein